MVSVIIPVYNVEKYLSICIESVLNQTYKDYEIILVDDGSTDNSLAICNEYASENNKIKVIHQENKGLSGARNTGVNNSTGEYIFFLDSDDCIDARLLEITTKLADYTNAAIVQINLKCVKEDFKPEKEINNEINNEVNDKELTIVSGDKLQLGDTNYTINYFDTVQAFYNLDKDNKNYAEDIRLTTTVAWSKLYRRAAFNTLLFPEEVRLHEDQMTAHRRIQEAKGMVFADIPLYYYRQANNNSLIRVGWTTKRLSILDCYEDRLKCADEIDKDNKTNKTKELLDYIYLRTLVCFFRNYCMVSKNVKGEEAIKHKRTIINRMKKIISSKTGDLSITQKLFFNTFVAIPGIFVMIFNMRNK